MSYKKIFWGIILITIGVLIMLKNLNLIWFSWHSLWALWPVLLVLWGISVLPVKDYIKLIISLVVVGISIAVVSTQPEINVFGITWHRNNHNWNLKYDSDSSNSSASEETYSEPFEKKITQGTLDLDAAAGRFIVGETTDKLYDFAKSGGDIHYQNSVEKDSAAATIRLKLKDGQINAGRGGEAHIKLNPNPVWDINFSVGAADLQMDLSQYKVNKLKLEGGASSIALKMGGLNEDQHVNISAGASSINIKIPKDRACEVKTNTILSSRELPGFNRIERHLYRTNNFNTAKIKTYVNVDAAVSSLNVELY